MNYCDKCDYKVISNKMFEAHKLTHIVEYPEEKKAIVEESPVKEEVKEVIPEQPSGITIKFTKSVEIFINSKAYLGNEITVQDMSVASEIVRLAREAYGPTILA